RLHLLTTQTSPLCPYTTLFRSRDADTPTSGDQPPAAASPYWGDEVIWNSKTTVHSFAMDKEGRVWAAARIRKGDTPAWCRAGSRTEEHTSELQSRGLLVCRPLH